MLSRTGAEAGLLTAVVTLELLTVGVLFHHLDMLSQTVAEAGLLAAMVISVMFSHPVAEAGLLTTVVTLELLSTLIWSRESVCCRAHCITGELSLYCISVVQSLKGGSLSVVVVILAVVSSLSGVDLE